jgi:hypothetical protein
MESVVSGGLEGLNPIMVPILFPSARSGMGAETLSITGTCSFSSSQEEKKSIMANKGRKVSFRIIIFGLKS